jgi:hypothetical protein
MVFLSLLDYARFDVHSKNLRKQRVLRTSKGLVMPGTGDYIAYIRDLVYLLRETGAEARRERDQNPGSEFEQGRALAYVEVLSLMQNQADSFMISKEEIGLAGFDPLNDPLDPPKPGPLRIT